MRIIGIAKRNMSETIEKLRAILRGPDWSGVEQKFFARGFLQIEFQHQRSITQYLSGLQTYQFLWMGKHQNTKLKNIVAAHAKVKIVEKMYHI